MICGKGCHGNITVEHVRACYAPRPTAPVTPHVTIAQKLAQDDAKRPLGQSISPKQRCERCAGTGQFITGTENGKPTGPGGPCFRCAGKGYQTRGDERRNYGYDNFAPIRY